MSYFINKEEKFRLLGILFITKTYEISGKLNVIHLPDSCHSHNKYRMSNLFTRKTKTDEKENNIMNGLKNLLIMRLLLCTFMLFAAVPLIFTGCSFQDDKKGVTGPGTDGINVDPNQMVAVVKVAIPPGSTCQNGGQMITVGYDTNSDGIPDTGMVDYPVCNGLSGSAGPNGLISLVTITQEPAGGNCTNGGQKIESGLDDDSDGILQALEVDATRFICNGANGSNGSGLNSLVNVLPESAGVNCTNGGQRIESGMDDNSNTILESIEIDSVQYVCNGVDGTNGTNGTNGIDGTNGTNGFNSAISTAPATGCSSGGTRVNMGLDDGTPSGIAGNNILETGEIDHSFEVCDGTSGGGGSLSVNDGNIGSPRALNAVSGNGALIKDLSTIAPNGTSYYSFSAFDDGNAGTNIDAPYTIITEGLESELSMELFSGSFGGTAITPLSCYLPFGDTSKYCQTPVTSLLTEGTPYYLSLTELYGVPSQYRMDVRLGADEGSDSTPLDLGAFSVPADFTTYIGPMVNYMDGGRSYYSFSVGTTGMYSVQSTTIQSVPNETGTYLRARILDNAGNEVSDCQGIRVVDTPDQGYGCVADLTAGATYTLNVRNGSDSTGEILSSGAKINLHVETGDTVNPALSADVVLPNQMIRPGSNGVNYFQYTPAVSGYAIFKAANMNFGGSLEIYSGHPDFGGTFMGRGMADDPQIGSGEACWYFMNLTAGTTYYMSVNTNGFYGDTMDISVGQPPAIPLGPTPTSLRVYNKSKRQIFTFTTSLSATVQVSFQNKLPLSSNWLSVKFFDSTTYTQKAAFGGGFDGSTNNYTNSTSFTPNTTYYVEITHDNSDLAVPVQTMDIILN